MIAIAISSLEVRPLPAVTVTLSIEPPACSVAYVAAESVVSEITFAAVTDAYSVALTAFEL